MESTLSLLRRLVGGRQAGRIGPVIGPDAAARRADARRQRPRVIDAASASSALLRKYRAARIIGDAPAMDALRAQLRSKWLQACAEHRHGEARAWHMAYLRAAEDLL